MAQYTVTRPVRPSGLVVAKVQAADPAEAARVADSGTWAVDPEFAADGHAVDMTVAPEVWEIRGFLGRGSRHVAGPRYGG